MTDSRDLTKPYTTMQDELRQLPTAEEAQHADGKHAGISKNVRAPFR